MKYLLSSNEVSIRNIYADFSTKIHALYKTANRLQ